MKNAKKLIIASVLSMMTASCYAGSIVAGSEQKSSVDIGFISPQLILAKESQCTSMVRQPSHRGV